MKQASEVAVAAGAATAAADGGDGEKFEEPAVEEV